MLHCVVRIPTTTLPLSYGPILPWALFPFKVLPSILNAYPKSSGAIPPKRHCSELVPPERVRSELPSRVVKAGHKRFVSIPAVVQLALPPATKPAPKHQVLPACRPVGQPAIESLERPFMYFPIPIHRPRRSPVDRLLVLQRPFQVEVALISRVFRSSDRNLLSDCISSSVMTETSSSDEEVASCARHRLFPYASLHRSVPSVSATDGGR